MTKNNNQTSGKAVLTPDASGRSGGSSIKTFATTDHPGDALGRLSSETDCIASGRTKPIPASELMGFILDRDAVVAVLEDTFTDEMFSKCRNLKLVANVAVGYDNIDIASANKHGVLVLNTPGVLDNSTADLAFAMLMSVARRLGEADRYVRSGRWQAWSTDLMIGTDIAGKKLGIVGFGRIGQAMAKRACGFDMRIQYAQRNRASAEIEARYGAEHVELDELLKQSDFVSLHCPLTPHTRHLFGARQFDLMQKHCILINTSRGPVIDEAALVNALAARKIAGAGLDVFEHEPQVPREMLSMENVVLAPHIGSASFETRSAMATLAVDGVIGAFSGKLPANTVNPEVWPQFLERLKLG